MSLFKLRGDLDADVMQTLNHFHISGVRSLFYRVELKTVSSQASFFQEAGINFIFLVRDLGTCL